MSDTIVSNTLSGATFAGGETATGSWVATYNSSGVLTSVSDVDVTVSLPGYVERFISAEVSSASGTYSFELIADTSSYDYGSLHENEYGGVYPVGTPSVLAWTTETPTSLNSASVIYDGPNQTSASPLAVDGVVSTSTGYTPGYTQVTGSPDPANIESGKTLYIFDSHEQTVNLTTDTSIVYEADTTSFAARNLDLGSLALGDSVTIVSADVFGGAAPTSGSVLYDNGEPLLVVQNATASVGVVVESTFAHEVIVESENGAGNYVFTATAPCFRRGTAIRTPGGDVLVEDLKAGDFVTLADGTAATVKWLGHRKVDCAGHPKPEAVWPVLVREGAFAEGAPARDLYLSPGHSVFVHGVLMQAEKLINGATILQVETDAVEYWHVELESHAIILAEGLPAESYLDQGNRTHFINGGAFVEAHPDFQPKHWAETCAKLVFEGKEMQDAKAMLLARAAEMGHVLTQEDGLHVMADGKRIEPVELGGSRQVFVLPAGAQAISLRSRTFIPNQVKPANSDKRSLGIRVGRLQLDGVDIALDDQTVFAAGWHKLETQPGKPDARWTTGETPIPAKTRLIMIDRAGRGHYWTPKEAARDNVVALFG
jgi:hypothetical protein